MLTKIQLRNFKSYKTGTLHLGRLTLLIGANASGKSNVIEALRFLSRIAEGQRLSLIDRAYSQDENMFRGGVKNIGYRGSQSFGLLCKTTEGEWQELSIDFRLGDGGELYVAKEHIKSPGSAVPLYEISSEPQGAGSDVFVSYNNFARGGRKPKIVCSSHMAIFTQLLSDIRFREENQESRRIIPKVAERYVQDMSRIVFLEPEPSSMRSYGHKVDKVLKKHGENLSGVIYNLCRDPEVKEIVLKFIRSLPEQNIQDISFIETPRDEVLLQLTESFGNISTTYDASILSDGTLRVLAIAAAMLSAPKESLVVIEEIDNGVHPSRAADLLANISTIASERKLRVLISSHNPALLDALPDEAIPETVFCYRSPQDGSSQLVQLQDIPDYPELIAQGTVGHLMTHGILERFVKQYPGPEQKKQQAMDWLATLKQIGNREL